MLLDKINENIQHYDFSAAYKDLKEYLKRGNSESRSNTMLRTELDFFHQTYKDRLKNPPIHDIRKISKRLQELAVSIETEIEVTHKSWWNYWKFLWGGLGFILVNFGVDSCNSYQNLTKFHDKNKTHLLVYDFDKFLSNGTYDLEDLIHLSISESSIWSDYFESNRKTGDKIFNKSFVYSNKFPWSSEWFASTINSLNLNLKAHHGITGHVQQAKNNTLSIHMEAHDTDNDTAISEIHIENLEDVQALKDNPCALHQLIRLIDFKKIETVKKLITNLNKNLNSCQNNMDYQHGLVNEVKELAFKSMRHLKSKEDSINLLKLLHEKIDDLYIKPKKEVCDALFKLDSNFVCNKIKEDEPDPNSFIYKVYHNELKPIENKSDAQVEFLKGKNGNDTIQVTAFYFLNRKQYRDKPDTDNYIKEIREKVFNKYSEKIEIHGDGYACLKGFPEFNNTELSDWRIQKMLEDFGIPLKEIKKQKEERYHAMGVKDPIVPDSPEDPNNRRATIKIYEKENANSGQATLIKNSKN